jgi:LPS-assembly protein
MSVGGTCGAAAASLAEMLSRGAAEFSSAGAAVEVSGYVSGAGRGAAKFKRRPQRAQRPSSSSFQALQYRHCIASQFNLCLTHEGTLCYGRRLGKPLAACSTTDTFASILRNIFAGFCHVLSWPRAAAVLLPVLSVSAQIYRPPLPPPPATTQPSPNPNQRTLPPREGAPNQGEVNVHAIDQTKDGPVIHLRGAVMIETPEMMLKADEVDYNQETGDAEARGHVHFEHFLRGERLDCDRAIYNTDAETGEFYNVSGSAPARVEARPGLLTTKNPFYFEAKWAERLKDHYILHKGFLTDCLIPRPWWTLKGPEFVVVPGDHAIARRSWFYLKSMPLFYAPFFYKSLKKEPRRSGFLIPNFGNSSLRGTMVGGGYYWVINRSYDVTYRAQFFSNVGVAHHVDFRGKVNQTTDFDFILYGVNDHSQNQSVSTGGVQFTLLGKSDLGHGWEARGELNYLSSFAFRQEFTESFHEAINAETHSVGYIDRHWSDFTLNFVAQRNVNFQSTLPNDSIVTRKLPEVQFKQREHEILKDWPVWFSMDSSAGLERRTQPLFQTRQFVERLDAAPRVTTAFHWLGISLMPSFGIRETFYDSSVANGPISNGGTITGDNVLRSSRDVTVDLILPSLARVFDAPAFMGEKVKHVIEPRVTYRYVTGIDDFSKVIRFDETDILTNTNEAEFSLTNRLLAKDKNGNVSDLLSWQLWYKRYFDPTFGGAVLQNTPGTGFRNVIDSTVDITGYAFLSGPRRDSPIVSVFRYQSRLGVEWRTDYDLQRHGFVNSGLTVDGRFSNYFVSLGHNSVRTDQALAPSANQFRGIIGYGNDQRRGWNYGFSAYYDYRKGTLQYSQTQVTYNTDCCGFSVQFRRFEFGPRNENQFRVAFAVSNIGTFGTLKRQERIF